MCARARLRACVLRACVLRACVSAGSCGVYRAQLISGSTHNRNRDGSHTQPPPETFRRKPRTIPKRSGRARMRVRQDRSKCTTWFSICVLCVSLTHHVVLYMHTFPHPVRSALSFHGGAVSTSEVRNVLLLPLYTPGRVPNRSIFKISTTGLREPLV